MASAMCHREWPVQRPLDGNMTAVSEEKIASEPGEEQSEQESSWRDGVEIPLRCPNLTPVTYSCMYATSQPLLKTAPS